MSTERTDHAERLRRALTAIQRLQGRVDELEGRAKEPIAVVGMACRFPGGVRTPDDYWALLRDGVDAITEIPKDRFDLEAVFSADPAAVGKTYARFGGFVDDIGHFDPEFFGIAPREAVGMDPQHRLLLEYAWAALEDACIPPSDLEGSATGVFVGITGSDYAQVARSAGERFIDAYHSTGTTAAFAAGRLSYALGFEGPSMSVDTACSSSLVAIHLGCESLRRGESDLALAGGVHALLSPEEFITTSKLRMLSPDGRCHTFDVRANGFVRGEGCGMVALKRVSDARRDGDRILAVIRGTAVNQDGASSGLTVPNKLAQESVIRSALAAGGVAPADVGYIEAHGTGTPLGDPIELRALGAVLSEGRPSDAPFLVGSVKSNFGHLEAAAGIAGFMKAVLVVSRGEVPASLHFEDPNPHVPWAEIPAVVPTSLTKWEPTGARIAGISSFGASGTNAHAVLSSWNEEDTERASRPPGPRLLATSARTPEDLARHAARLQSHLESHPDLDPFDVCGSANTGRTHFPYRRAVIGTTLAELADGLTLSGPSPSVRTGHVTPGSTPRVAFLYTGQGAQHGGMAAALYDRSPVFREALDECMSHVEGPLLDAILGRSENADDLLRQTGNTQPALYAVQYALTRLWASLGVTPAAVLGHSVGEIAAAHAAGVLSARDGMTLATERGRAMQALPVGGSMAAVRANEPTTRTAIDSSGVSGVTIAAINGPSSTVVSGPADELAVVISVLQKEGIETEMLVVSHAFHSTLMDPALATIEATAARLSMAPPRVTLLSNVTGRQAGDEVAGAGYWRRHAREPVRFHDGFRTLLDNGCDALVEIGPHPTLLGMGRAIAPDDDLAWVPSLRRNEDGWTTFLRAVAELYTLGVPLRLDGLDAGDRHRKLSLPTYPFLGERYWVDAASAGGSLGSGFRDTGHPLLGARFLSASEDVLFQSEWGVEREAYLADHRLSGRPLAPAAAFVEAAREAVARVLPAPSVRLRDVVIHEPLFLPADGSVVVQTVVRSLGDTGSEVRLSSRAVGDDSDWKLHLSAIGQAGSDSDDDAHHVPSALAPEQSPEDFYAGVREKGLDFGPRFRSLRSLASVDGEATAVVELHDTLDSKGYGIHPVLLDACLQSAGSLMPSDGPTYVPVAFESVRVASSIPRRLHCEARAREGSRGSSTIVVDVVGADPEGMVCVRVEGLTLRPVATGALPMGESPDGHPLFHDFSWIDADTPDASDADGIWVLVHGSELPDDCTASLVATLRERGGEVCLLARSPEEELDVALRELLTTHAETVRAVVAIAPARPADDSGTTSELLGGALAEVAEAHDRLMAIVLATIRSMTSVDSPPPLWFVTRGAQDTGLPFEETDPLHAILWGFARILSREAEELSPRCLDLPLKLRDATCELATSHLCTPGRENQIALRAGGTRVARLTPRRDAPGPSLDVPESPFGLESHGAPTIDNLVVVPIELPSPQPLEIVVEVRAAGLGFRDVLNALGAYPDGPVPFGSEFAGVVTAVGADVTRHRVGDRVTGVAPEALRSHTVTHESLATEIPSWMSFSQAATLPSAFLTAWRALVDLALLSPDDRVLVHAGAGGVGLAAVQIALDAGATVFATAGNEAKRAVLRELGVHHVLDSRTLDFRDRILEETGGGGVDVVLNSLAGDFIDASVAAMAPGGRFVEVGKRDIWTLDDMAEVRPQAAYHVLDLADISRTDPTVIAETFDAILDAIRERRLRPLPITCFDMPRVRDAFRFMAQARHIGKIVILPRGRAVIDPEGTYLITGGLGGLGLSLAARLAERGARHLLLASRHDPDERQSEALADLRAGGVQVRTVRADVSQPDDLVATFDAIDPNHPIRGVVHAAMVLDDGIALRQSVDRARAVFAPKVSGAWLLDRLTPEVDFFVLYSAGAGLVGSPGQSVYAGANSFLDAIALRRARRAGDALSISWGPWAEVGVAAGQDLRLASEGVERLTPREALDAFEDALAWPTGSAHVAVMRMDWARLAEARGGPESAPPLFADLARRGGGRERPASPRPEAADPAEITKRITEAPPARRRGLIASHVKAQVVRALQLPANRDIDARQPLQEIGLDSLMAVELRTLLGAGLSLDPPLPATVALDHPTIEELTNVIHDALFADVDAPTVTQPAPVDRGERADISTERVADLTDEEAEAELLAELDALSGPESDRG